MRLNFSPYTQDVCLAEYGYDNTDHNQVTALSKINVDPKMASRLAEGIFLRRRINIIFYKPNKGSKFSPGFKF